MSFIAHPDYITERRERNVYEALLDYLRQMVAHEKIWAVLPGRSGSLVESKEPDEPGTSRAIIGKSWGRKKKGRGWRTPSWMATV